MPVLLVGGVMAIIAGVMGVKDRGGSSSSAASESSEPAISVSAEQLHKDYAANEVSADDRYRGQVLVVSGVVSAIRKNIFDDPYIELATNHMFESVSAHFEESSAGALGKLSRGDRVTVRCIGNGAVIGRPQLKNCTLQ